MEIILDRASKFYEPGEKVTGQIIFNDFKLSDSEKGAGGLTLKAESYMDTVSQIRGNMGRGPLEENLKIYFMKKIVTHSENSLASAKGGRIFDFILDATEQGEKLIDVYVGVDFSIVVSLLFTNHIFIALVQNYLQL